MSVLIKREFTNLRRQMPRESGSERAIFRQALRQPAVRATPDQSKPPARAGRRRPARRIREIPASVRELESQVAQKVARVSGRWGNRLHHPGRAAQTTNADRLGRQLARPERSVRDGDSGSVWLKAANPTDSSLLRRGADGRPNGATGPRSGSPTHGWPRRPRRSIVSSDRTRPRFQ